MDNNKTSEGLRIRLFDALDLFIAKKVTSKEIEGICYLSEQILKTASIELDFQRECNKRFCDEQEYNLRLKIEENEAAERLQITMKKVLKDV